jgi:DNA-binding XRE family transcriptional regulator
MEVSIFELNERIRAVRKHFTLTQTEFGARLGVSRSVVNNWERTVVVPPGTVCKAVCAEFSVNEQWLRTGDGKMFIDGEESLIARLVKQHNLDFSDRKILECYIALPESHREVIRNFIRNLSEVYAIDPVG